MNSIWRCILQAALFFVANGRRNVTLIKKLQVRSCKNLVEALRITVAMKKGNNKIKMQLTVAEVWLDHARKRAVGVQSKEAIQTSCDGDVALIKPDNETVTPCRVPLPPQPAPVPQQLLPQLQELEESGGGGWRGGRGITAGELFFEDDIEKSE